eukprot:gb/GEZN01023597.1/.p1 GENE.gb/GEZN01023597.1/~~gb/GEZN01023597.1/.p1  ORF type:complete len:172 (-),score=21.83 gb/GEZN01023597.1/:74-532(-)
MGAAQSNPPVVASFDVKAYLGRWYQIADYLQFYEILCKDCTTANYALKSDGTIQVWNTCTNVFQNKGVEAYAFAPNASEPAKLTVVFFGQVPANTNYWICYLGPLNSAGLYSYAVVSNANEDSLYILNREPSLTSAAQKVNVLVLYHPVGSS